jgi:hypothetical protein
MFGVSVGIAATIFGAGLVVGWCLLPCPAFVRDFFVRIGWARA